MRNFICSQSPKHFCSLQFTIINSLNPYSILTVIIIIITYVKKSRQTRDMWKNKITKIKTTMK